MNIVLLVIICMLATAQLGMLAVTLYVRVHYGKNFRILFNPNGFSILPVEFNDKNDTIVLIKKLLVYIKSEGSRKNIEQIVELLLHNINTSQQSIDILNESINSVDPVWQHSTSNVGYDSHTNILTEKRDLYTKYITQSASKLGDIVLMLTDLKLFSMGINTNYNEPTFLVKLDNIKHQMEIEYKAVQEIES